MRHINDTTFISDNLGDLKPVVTIGGKPVGKFIPNLNMSFHDDEFFINLNRRDKQAISATDKAEIDGIDKDIFYIDENGRFKWDIEFKERPAGNLWAWELKHADGIEFYYQGELTAEEIADGCERSAEVVGSYAVYCNKANNKYKTGKICHIYRPFCYDINGESIYADLLIADGQLIITIDETWLDNASYPVRLDPTIGYTTAGASSYGESNFLAIQNAQASTGGTATKVYAHLNGTATISLGYYTDPTSSPSLVGSGTVSSSSKAWYSVDVTGAITNANRYGSAICLPSAGVIYYDTGGASGVSYYGYGSGGTCPASPSGLSADTWLYSIYLEYTESGGATGNSYYYQQQQM